MRNVVREDQFSCVLPCAGEVIFLAPLFVLFYLMRETLKERPAPLILIVTEPRNEGLISALRPEISGGK
jgi:hypothetical protein